MLFSGADMRDFACAAAIFEDCVFENARLDKVDFQGSSFERCRFIGRLNEVIFQDVAFGHEDLEPNRMIDVDFSGADLFHVEFRKLALDRVAWPDDEMLAFVREADRACDEPS